MHGETAYGDLSLTELDYDSFTIKKSMEVWLHLEASVFAILSWKQVPDNPNTTLLYQKYYQLEDGEPKSIHYMSFCTNKEKILRG